MTLSAKLISIGKGRVSSARKNAGGVVAIVVSRGDALIKKEIPAGATLPTFTQGSVVSYADDCYVLDGGILHRNGDFSYVSFT